MGKQEIVPCIHNIDGYCAREENNYCPGDVCLDFVECLHPKEHQFIDVIESIINCETTVIRCAICRTALTEPITDCP